MMPKIEMVVIVNHDGTDGINHEKYVSGINHGGEGTDGINHENAD